jgi:hypothetical protein
VKEGALEELADPPPEFGENLVADYPPSPGSGATCDEAGFVGNVYVYRGPYPRSDGTKQHKVERATPSGSRLGLGIDGRKASLAVPDFANDECRMTNDEGEPRRRRGAPAGNRNGRGARI